MITAPIPINSTKIWLTHDRDLSLAVGSSRRSTTWRTETLSIADLYWRLSLVRHTAESLAEYRAMTRDQQADAKDVGGFVGGVLSGPRRQALAVAEMHCALLDADQADDDFITAMDLLPWSWAAYTTHSHDPDRGKNRWRAVVPYSRGVTPDEHQAIARKLAGMIGDAYFDPTTFQPHRLFYWPSSPADGEFEFVHTDRALLDVDAVLASYGNAADISQWPVSARQEAGIQNDRGRAGEPGAKAGLVGAFCRCWDVPRAIEEFLPTVYELGAHGRYTYLAGSSLGGAVLYDDGQFLYSHHSTDPASMKLLNPWDLVRLHQFGHLDKDAKDGTPINRMPSHVAMEELVMALPEIKRQLVEERLRSARADFPDAGEAGSGVTPEDEEGKEWMDQLQMDKHGKLKQTRGNYELVLRHDPALKGKIYLDEFRDTLIGRNPLPWPRISGALEWTDFDSGELRMYLEKKWALSPIWAAVIDALNHISIDHAEHPVREYLTGLTWDGVPRLDSILTDYLGVEPTEFTRAVGRKFLASAVARVMEPGCKADHTLLLCGPERMGKSSFPRVLAGEWYSDSLPHLGGGKDVFEALRGAWIIEIAELNATRRADVEAVKHFLTKQSDRYREAYAHKVREFKRQCVFIATTNENEPLVDTTGNRRFWPVKVGKHRPNALWIAELEQLRDQIWAEAVVAYQAGEKLYLDDEMEEVANQIQDEHRPEDAWKGQIEHWLEFPVPEDWYGRDHDMRRRYLSGQSPYKGRTILRDRVCIAEIWEECLGGHKVTLDGFKSRRINALMRSLPDWEEKRSIRHPDFKATTVAGYVRRTQEGPPVGG